MTAEIAMPLASAAFAVRNRPLGTLAPITLGL